MLGRYLLKGIKTPLRFRTAMVAARNWGDDSRGGRGDSRGGGRDNFREQKRGY